MHYFLSSLQRRPFALHRVHSAGDCNLVSLLLILRPLGHSTAVAGKSGNVRQLQHFKTIFIHLKLYSLVKCHLLVISFAESHSQGWS